MKKRVIAFLLSVCLSFSICAGTAFAEEPANTVDQIEKQAEVSITPVAADEEEPSSTPDDSEVLTPVPAPDFSENGDVEEPADETPAEEKPEVTVPDTEAPAEDVLPDENTEDTTEITDDMTEEAEFEEEESELGTYEGSTDPNRAIELECNQNPKSDAFPSSSGSPSLWYKFWVPSRGKIGATFTHRYAENSYKFAYLTFYNSNMDPITKSYTSLNSTMSKEIPSVGVDGGAYYYLKIQKWDANDLNFTIKINYTKDSYCETELNDTRDTADYISSGYTYNGRDNTDGDVDYYRITAPSDGYFSFSFSHNYNSAGRGWRVTFYNNDMDVLHTQAIYEDETNIQNLILPVSSGSYYLKITPIEKYYPPSVPYSFSFNFKADNTYEKELNDDQDYATLMSLNKTFHGILLNRAADHDYRDYFKFTATTDTFYTIKFGHSYTPDMYWDVLLKSTYKDIQTWTYKGTDDSSSQTYRIHLTPGTYYLCISHYRYDKITYVPYTIQVDQSKVAYSPVTEFVGRLYKYCLNRDPDDSGLSYWASLLSRKEMTGAQVAQNFVFSPEFLQQNIENGKFVDRLYLAFFGRESDSSGYYYWTGRLSHGMSRRTVAANFINSAEFLSICNSYGIVRGSIGSSGTSATRSQIEAYVKRCYTQILGRSGDSDGINYWTTLIQNGQSRPVDVAKSFVGSREFSLKQLNNTEFVKVMYRAFMGREYDTGGLNYWVNQMNRGMSKNEVLNNFANSKEFSLIMNSMGV